MLLQVWLNLIILFQFGILLPNSGEDKKKVCAAFWFYLSPEFRISCCQVGITCQKTEGPDIFSPLQCQTRGGCRCPPPKINTYVCRLFYHGETCRNHSNV